MRHVRSARITTGNSSPFALWTVISRTPSLPSSRIGASAASPLAAELLRNPVRMKRQRPEPMPVLEQQLVVDREQRAFERREDRELVVGPLDRGERRANGFDFFAAVKRLAADEQVRHAARFERID